MIFELRLAGVHRKVEVQRDATGQPRFLLDGLPMEADAVEISPGTFSILLRGHVFEARVEPLPDGLFIYCEGREFPAQVRDPRAWRRDRGGALEAEGPQQVTAPMPGKIVRILIGLGETVQSGQGLVVVEAMKMQNEIRSPKSGSVERIFVRENQTVAAGKPLVRIA